jgi:acetolactate decarboxylase
MKKHSFLILAIVFASLLLSGCAERNGDTGNDMEVELSGVDEVPPESTGLGNDILYQVSTLDALLQSVYDGILPIEELETHGDFGIGTFDGLEGEMLALDGDYYQMKTDGLAYPVSGEMTTPFATVTFFETDESFGLEGPMNLSEFETFLDSKLPSENLFYAVRVEGNFSFMKARSVPKQEKPYPRLVDVVSTQAVFEFENISGTLVGFRAPDYVKGVNVPGYHIHFITTDRSAGGHVLDFELEEGDAAVDITRAFFMELPTSGDFYEVELGQDLQSDLERVEK